MQRDAAFRSDVSEQLPRMPGVKSCRAQPFAVSAIAPALPYYRTSMCISLRRLVRNSGWILFSVAYWGVELSSYSAFSPLGSLLPKLPNHLLYI